MAARLAAVLAALGALALTGALTGAASATDPCTIYWTGGAGGSSSDWATAHNWSTDAAGTQVASNAPTSSDFVCMSSNITTSSIVVGSATVASVGGLDVPDTVPFDLQGSLTAGTGSSQIGSLTMEGTIAVHQGILRLPKLANLTSGTLSGGSYSVSGGGQMQLPGTVQTVATGTSMATDSTAGSEFTDLNSANALAALQTNNGSITLGQALAVTGPVANAGTLTIVAGGNLTSPSLSNSGVAHVSGGSLTTTSGSFTNSNTVAINAGGTLTAAGSYIQTGGSGDTELDTGATLAANGAGGVDIRDGLLVGNGTVKGNLMNDGAGSSILPFFGGGAGPMTVMGNYDIFLGTLQINVAGTTAPGVDFSQLALSGTANLSGTLTVASQLTPCPAIGTQLIILKAGSVHGTFSTVNQPPGSTCNFGASYTATSVVLTEEAGNPQGAAPSVSGISPSYGVPGGGDSVTITGTHLTGASAVHFGGAAAEAFKVVNDGEITATSPAGGGTVDVTVTTPGGTSATNGNDRFTYIPQAVISAVDGALNSAVNAISNVNPATAAQTGSINVPLTLNTPGTLGMNLVVLQTGHIARVLKKGTVLARGKVVARPKGKGKGKVKLSLRLTAAGKAALRKLGKALPIQLKANFVTPQGVTYSTQRGARIRPRHHAGSIR